MQQRLLVFLLVLVAGLAGPGIPTGLAGDAPWLSKGGSFDACLLRSNQNLNREPLANAGFGQYRGAMDNEWDVALGCLRSNVDFDLSGDLSFGVPNGRLSFTVRYDLFNQFNESWQGKVKFKEKTDADLGIKFGYRMAKVPAGYNSWTQYIRMDYQRGGTNLFLGWNAKVKGKGRANDLVVCGGYVFGVDPILTFSEGSAEERLIATLMAQAKAEIEALAKLERPER